MTTTPPNNSLVPHTVIAQALSSLQSVRVRYNTRKATVKPEGALKTAIDEIDRQIAEAGRSGNTAQLRRLMAKGLTLLNGREWTPALDYTNSIVIRTEQLVVAQNNNRLGSWALDRIVLSIRRGGRRRGG